MSELEGILPVYKPAGFTSHDVVAKVRGILRTKRIGHTGTLDPMVTGVLPLCIGRATRMVEYLQDLPKEYKATLRLGVATDTEDLTGNTIEQVPDVQVSEEDVRTVLERFVGVISQVPPMYSAVKVDGKRLYELAREGKTIERKAREVTIYELELTSFDIDEYTEISFRVLCSKGTYIRTLCVDIGRELGVPSTMAKLERTMSAGIPLSRCLTFEQIKALMKEDRLEEYVIRMDEAISHLPAHYVPEEKKAAATQGQRLSSKIISPQVTTFEPIRLYAPDGQFLGIFKKEDDSGAIAPVKVFLPE
ncbi:tRNA pseudouridine(55) synthase TruB [Paenibacillus sediminis]|uniref:tRNA pseudouridine synthase B n=1 Tax=Paenibacillus sediminis TaxID=664909 RepID=A0ABS4H1G8_9BACL|nr:tRNA pseudouridine(55) synthase TruB [Paenibacillus sediminis]MBP1936377.1 tRNA pseudouridine55 synthase [Paenibacillus sediminis]